MMCKTGCTASKYQVIHALNPRTKSHTISEVNNILYGTSGSVELNLTFDMNTQELALKFHYRDQDWLFIKEQASFMFIFDDGDIISLSHLGKIHANVTKDGPRPEIIEEWGEMSWTRVMMKKISQKKIIGMRINGDKRYKEYDRGMRSVQSRWKKILQKYPEMKKQYQ